MSRQKFRIGDTVLRINTDYCDGQEVGTTATVVFFCEDGILVRTPLGSKGFWETRNAELVEPVAYKPTDETLLIDAIPTLAAQASEVIPYLNAALDLLAEHLKLEDYRRQILAEATDRFITGFVEYGDEMFKWDNDRLKMNGLQEIADFSVYIAKALHNADLEADDHHLEDG